MKKASIIISSLLVLGFLNFQGKNAAPLYVFDSGKITFFSETPVENIKAETKTYAAAVNPDTREFAFIVYMTSFQFKKKQMQEHFNENYMESEKYPKATFSGNIVENIDLLKDGKHTINAKGKLTIHGVEKERTLPVSIEIKGGKLTLSSKFQVKLVDHNIEVPSVVVANIAEIIDVSVDGVLKPKQ
jgi:polyisoprenoid-binding protein YceI